jgi:hypothetical protein
MNVSQRPEHLISIKLDKQLRNTLLHLNIMSHNSVDSFGNVIHYNVQVDLVRLED